LVCTGDADNLFQGGTCAIYLGVDGSKTEFRMPSVPYTINLRNWWGYNTLDDVAYIWPTKTTLADGEVLTYNYVNYGEWNAASGHKPAATKWNSIESSLGFRVYLSKGTPTGTRNPGSWLPPGILADGQVGDLFAINTSAEYADPLTLNRTFSANAISSLITSTTSTTSLTNNGVLAATATISGNVVTIRSPSGLSVTYTGIPGFGPFATNWGNNPPNYNTISTPANSFPSTSFSVTRGSFVTSYNITMNRNIIPESYQGTVTNPDGSTESFNVRYGLLQSQVDGLARSTTYGYSGQEGYFNGIPGYARLTRIQSIALPGGSKQIFDYKHGGITASALIPSDGGTSLITQLNLPASCTVENYRICNKPTSIIDPKGNQADITYAPAHGGVLTETLPADANGIRPQKRYTYALLYPKVLNASGALVNSTPVWRLTRISECQSATLSNPASCVGTAAEKITTYAYDSNNLFMTSETASAGDGLLSMTTSYTYDYRGDVTSVDGPRTDVDDKSYVTYNALRQKVFEIGPDPDGTGPLPRPMVRHLYDADGREWRTESGAGNAIDGSDFVVQQIERMSFDPGTGDLVKTEVGQP